MRAGRIMSAAVLVFGVVGFVSAPKALAQPRSERLAGGDAYSTSVAVSQAGWASAGGVVIASADSWPDSLAASSLGLPVLLSGRDGLPGPVVNEIHRLDAHLAIVVGGRAVLSDTVRTELRGLGLAVVEAA